jgi:3-methyladenine DNA glycosylase AlkD
MNAKTLCNRLRVVADPMQAALLQRFFKTGPGEYGEGDRFLGLRVPQLRAIVRECGDDELPAREIPALLKSPLHEERLLALLIMVRRYVRGSDADRQQMFDLYLASTRHINNWDLVDLSAPNIVGAHLAERDRSVLDRLARSASLWERRIAILATFHFIRRNDFADALHVADVLLTDGEDLIHKAVGWMLREVGKRDQAAEEGFLLPRYSRMPRTMLRYAIERFPEPRRQAYLQGRA